ncbi:MAG: hypothetical protein PHV33_13095 [Elusimicrobiales bacterium]|nr:hypothetical protein [Elusimicrobiales bacterium]
MKRRKKMPQTQKGNPEYDALLSSISEIAKSFIALEETAVAAYKPIVDDIISLRSKDHMEIQRTLDGMLGFCGNPAMLQLYEKLCRYYFRLDPAATSDYIGFYLEQWEPERYKKIIKEQKKKKARKP